MSYEPHPTPRGRVLYRRMLSRRTDELHRTATNLELFFDLCFVVAVAFASSRMHHALAQGHIGDGALHYAMVFFAIWWAWMNFTWFASAFDTDDVPYRLLTLLQMGGVLVLAAGVPRAFDNEDWLVVTIGYVIMRFAMVLQWLRAAQGDLETRPAAVRFAAGIAVLQAGWVGLLLMPDGLLLPGFGALVLAELLVPIWAERAAHTRWHPHHIAERYGLFTLIVMGESILASTTAIQVAIDSGHDDFGLISLAGTGLLIVFSLWWVYFDHPSGDILTSLSRGFAWGYGHLLVFASAAAIGAGIAVGIDYKTHEAHVSRMTAELVLAVPMAIFLLSVWALQILPQKPGLASTTYPLAALLILAIAVSGLPGQLLALPPVLLVVASVWSEARMRAQAEV